MVMMGPSFKFRKLHKFPQTDQDTSCSYGGHESRHHHPDQHHHHSHHHLTLPFSCRSSRLQCSSSSDQHPHMSPKKVPKGYVAVYAGVHDHDREGEDEEDNGDEDGDAEGSMDHESRYNVEGSRKRYLVPLSYLTHPAFEELLERAREEFGFRQQAGGLSLPCSPREFEAKLKLMQSELPDRHPHSPNCVPSLDHLVNIKPHWSIKLH